MEQQYFAPIYTEINVKHDNIEHVVGSYSKTYLIRVGQPKFIPFKCDIIMMYPYGIKDMVKFINEHRTNSNIVIEDDAKILILVALDMMLDNFLIYVPVQKRCVTVFEYAAKVFEIQPYTLNIYQIRQLMRAYVLLTQSFKNSNITWDVKIITNVILKSGYELFYSIMKQYFEQLTNKGIYSTNSILSKHIITYLNKHFKQTPEYTKNFQQFELEQVTNNDVYNAIVYLASL